MLTSCLCHQHGGHLSQRLSSEPDICQMHRTVPPFRCLYCRSSSPTHPAQVLLVLLTLLMIINIILQCVSFMVSLCSYSRTKLAIVDENSTCIVYDTQSKDIHFQVCTVYCVGCTKSCESSNVQTVFCR